MALLCPAAVVSPLLDPGGVPSAPVKRHGAQMGRHRTMCAHLSVPCPLSNEVGALSCAGTRLPSPRKRILCGFHGPGLRATESVSLTHFRRFLLSAMCCVRGTAVFYLHRTQRVKASTPFLLFVFVWFLLRGFQWRVPYSGL